MKIKHLINELSYRQVKRLQNKLLIEAPSGSSIVKIGDRKFAVTPQQREELISYLETAKSSKSREVEGEDGEMSTEEYEEAVAESASSEEVQEQLINGLKELNAVDKANKLLSFIGPGAPYDKLSKKDGGLLEALKLIVMDSGLPALKNALFSVKGSPDASGDVPVKLELPELLQPLFDVYEPGRADTMGRGEVYLALSYSESVADSGGEYDVTLGGVPFHVKDLRGSEGEEGLSKVDDSVALGKTGDWDKSVFPFNYLEKGGANLSKLSASRMKLAMPAVLAAYAGGAVEGFDIDSSLEEIASHFQDALDKAVIESDSFLGGGKTKAGGVIFGAAGGLYVAGPTAFHFSRTSQSALRVTPKAGIPGLGKSKEKMYGYTAVLESGDYIKKVQAKAEKVNATKNHMTALKNLASATSKEIEDHMATKVKNRDDRTKFIQTIMTSQGVKGNSLSDIKAMTPVGKEWDNDVLDILRGLAPESPPEKSIDKVAADKVAEEDVAEGILRSYRGERKLMKEHANQIVRAQNKAKPAIRRLIHEAFSSQEKDVVNQLAGKVVDQKWKKELESKVEALLDKQAKNFFNNDHFYKAVADVWKQLMRVYAQDQFKFARRYTRYDVPLAKYRP